MKKTQEMSIEGPLFQKQDFWGQAIPQDACVHLGKHGGNSLLKRMENVVLLQQIITAWHVFQRFAEK